MDLWLLKPGHKIRTHGGGEAEVLFGTEDGEWIRVRYLDTEDDPLMAGTAYFAERPLTGALAVLRTDRLAAAPFLYTILKILNTMS